MAFTRLTGIARPIPVGSTLAEPDVVNAHNLSVDIDKRPSGAAWIGQGVRLDKVVVGSLTDDPMLAADDSHGDGLLKAQRIADRQHPVADADPVGVTEAGEGKRTASLDLEQCEVGQWVPSHDPGVILLPVGRPHGDPTGVP
jgi:hypothetical protein